MSDIEFKSLNLKRNDSIRVIKINDNEIEVKQYLPIEDKIDLVQIALQQAETDFGYNAMLVDVYFYLYIVYFYSNIKFTDEEKEQPLELFDILSSNGVISAVAAAIPSEEFEDIKEYIDTQLEMSSKFKSSSLYLFNIVIDKIKDATKYLNENDYEKILNGIKANLVENGNDVS